MPCLHYSDLIYYTGFALFLLSVLIAQIAAGFQVPQLQLTVEQALRNMFFDLLNSAKTYMLLSAPFLTLFSVGLCLSNLSLIRHEGKRPVNLLGILPLLSSPKVLKLQA